MVEGDFFKDIPPFLKGGRSQKARAHTRSPTSCLVLC